MYYGLTINAFDLLSMIRLEYRIRLNIQGMSPSKRWRQCRNWCAYSRLTLDFCSINQNDINIIRKANHDGLIKDVIEKQSTLSFATPPYHHWGVNVTCITTYDYSVIQLMKIVNPHLVTFLGYVLPTFWAKHFFSCRTGIWTCQPGIKKWISEIFVNHPCMIPFWKIQT